MFGCSGGLCGGMPKINKRSFVANMGAAYTAKNVKTEGVSAVRKAGQERAAAEAAAAAAAPAPAAAATGLSANNRAKRVREIQQANNERNRAAAAEVAAKERANAAAKAAYYEAVEKGRLPNPFEAAPPWEAAAAPAAARKRSTRRRRGSSRTRRSPRLGPARRSRKIETRRARKNNGTRYD